MSLMQYFKKRGANGFGYGTTAEEVTEGLSLQGKRVLITGCNSGLGRETTRVLALRGASVWGTARTIEKAQEACQGMTGECHPLALDLSDPASMGACIRYIKEQGLRFDVIICNAGIMALPKLQQAFGIELQFFTNHIGHFSLVTGLLDNVSDDGRVVMLSSSAHNMAPKVGIEFDNLSGEQNYSPWKQYGQSKFANLVFAKELARRFEGSQKTACAVHPGVIQTNLGRHMSAAANFTFALVGPLLLKSIPQGAATQVYAAVHPSACTISGEYFADCNIAKCRPDAADPALGRQLWDVSEKIVAANPMRIG